MGSEVVAVLTDCNPVGVGSPACHNFAADMYSLGLLPCTAAGEGCGNWHYLWVVGVAASS